MGHGAFGDGYKKPNFRLHLIIFITIIGVSVFLSSQVEKSKNNTHVQALKIPVPIDSVFVDENGQETKPRIESPKVVAESAQAIQESEVEYRFDDGSSLANIDSMLARIDGNSEDETSAETIAAEESELSTSEASDATPAVDTKKEHREIEKDVAIMVTDDNVPAKEESAKVTKAEKKESLAKADSSEKNENKGQAKLDAVYELQQDRFLETLAKTASLKSEETLAVKRIKEAIRSDRPLSIKSAIKSKPKTGSGTALVKVAAANASGVMESKATSKSKVVVAKASTVSSKKSVIEKSTPSAIEQITVTKSELNNVLSQFARSYNKGDINRLMALFDDNAVTNDQKNKPGIKAEYDELFKTTSNRNIKIQSIHWNLSKDKAKGAAKFTVTVQPRGSDKTAQVQGSIEILAVKEDRGVFIKQLLHQVTGQ